MNTKTMTSLIAVTILAGFAVPNAFAFDVLHSFTLTEGNLSESPGTEYVGTFEVDSGDLIPNNFIPVENFTSFEVTIQTTSFTKGDHTGSTPDIYSEGVSTDGTGAVYTFEDVYDFLVFVTFTTDGGTNILNINENGDWSYTPSVGPIRNGNWTIALATPEEQTQSLIDAVGNLDLPGNQENSLINKLNSALMKIEDGNPANDFAACPKLDSFKQEVTNLEGVGFISTEDADDLRAAADLLKDSIGCP